MTTAPPTPSRQPASSPTDAQTDLLDTVARVARTGGWHLDVEQGRLWWSPQAAALFGWEQGGHSLEEAALRFAPEARAQVQGALREATLHGTPLDLLCQALLPCGAAVSVRLAGQAVRDGEGRITALHGAVRDMRESDERFHLVARATADAIWDWNLVDDTMWWNEGMETLFGVPLESLPPDSRSWTERLHLEDAQRVLAGLDGVIQGTGEHWSDEYRFRRQDGSYAWVRDRGFVLRDAQGRGWRMVGGMTDIGARKQVELQTQQEAQAHARLLRVQQQITRLEQPLAQVLQEAAQTACDLAGAESAVIELREGDALRVHARVGADGGPLPALHSVRALGEHPLWQRLTQPAPQGSDGLPDDHVACVQDGRRFIAAPLRGHAALAGLLHVTAAPGQEFSPRHLAHLRILAESLGALVQLRHADAQLRASELQYRALFAEHPQPMWVCERSSLRLLAANRAMAQHYGYGEDELCGMDLRGFWPAHERGQAAAAMQAAAASPSGPILAEHVRKDGTPIEMELFVGSTTFGGHDAWQVLANDVTGRRRIERELARLNRTQRMRSACSETLVRAGSEAELLHAVCRVAAEIGGYSLCWVGMVRDDERKSIEPVAHAGADEAYLEDLRRLSWSADDPHGNGPAGVTVRSGQTMIVRDIRTNPSFRSVAGQMARMGFHAVVCLPLRNAQRTFGLLQLYAPEVLHVGEEETQLLEAMAADLAFGIGNLRARAEQQRLQGAMLKVATAVSAGIGTEFFERLAHNMAQALDAQIACVARLLPPAEGQPPRAITLSHVTQGVVQPNAEYSLDGTPSRQLLTHRQFVIVDHAATLYPHAPVLTRAGARSYVGQQLTASDGTPVGLIFVMFAQPLEHADFVENTLRIFAARASAELERQTADARIRHQASLLDKARDAIIVRDLDHRITFWNEGAERMYGWTREEVLGRSIATLLYKDTRDFERATAAVMQQGDWSGEILQYDRNGRAIEAEGRWTLVRNDRGEPESVLAINADIGQRKESEREIQRLAFFDPLTGLPNRIRLMERIGQALRKAQHQRQGGALLFIDLDNFKTLNDTLGHDKGDQLLQLVAQRLTTCVRGVDTVARLGGDEFVVMVEDLSAEAEALALHARGVGEKILSVLSTPYVLTGYQYRSTPSIGIALFNDAPTTVGELLQQADLAMYQAKTAGRSTLRFFNPGMQLAVAERASLEADLRNALSQQEFLLHYQPQIDAQERIVGVEALLRWAHPQRGMVSPAQFIPLAEETGLILPLGRWVLHTACSMLAAWQHDPALAPLTMAVNVSSRQFRNDGFVDDVARVLAVTGAPPGQLKLELTESLLVEDMEATIATMEALRAHGVGFSLDDFGTGYSSLAYLKRMPLEQLKIDQSFVRDLLTDPNDAAIVRTIIALADSLGLEAIAEGVETVQQRDWLAQAGCQCYQGYFFSRPLPSDRLEHLLSTRCRA
ncbi:EAL domain-containing protein [Acidovorax sp. MR-S7]|uniref:EAL domain-containing protein n=1 Tax=Acidovorax sp. MR-S7 TaxID=1268622 RepID=UPI00036AE79C|nr:EAL domain-containing protein [Acidovorax sp. MR-S7]GAD21239.1 diguanylate cyclase/phosphodiesterase with PAS/PAC and GAF sensor [Acidovorax sp. MR-S7]